MIVYGLGVVMIGSWVFWEGFAVGLFAEVVVEQVLLGLFLGDCCQGCGVHCYG